MFTKNHNINKGKNHHNYSHGMARTRPYRIWNGMLTRCYNPNWATYEQYGRKGIRVSNSWKKFVNFWRDMGDTYFDGASIDRIDNNKGYSKENCRWATRIEQNNNKESIKLYEYNGKKLSITGWEKELGFKKYTLIARLKRGWSIEKTLTTPKKIHKTPGIRFCNIRKKWVASIKKDGKYKFLGRYSTEKEAQKARDNYLNKT